LNNNGLDGKTNNNCLFVSINDIILDKKDNTRNNDVDDSRVMSYERLRFICKVDVIDNYFAETPPHDEKIKDLRVKRLKKYDSDKYDEFDRLNYNDIENAENTDQDDLKKLKIEELKFRSDNEVEEEKEKILNEYKGKKIKELDIKERVNINITNNEKSLYGELYKTMVNDNNHLDDVNNWVLDNKYADSDAINILHPFIEKKANMSLNIIIFPTKCTKDGGTRLYNSPIDLIRICFDYDIWKQTHNKYGYMYANEYHFEAIRHKSKTLMEFNDL